MKLPRLVKVCAPAVALTLTVLCMPLKAIVPPGVHLTLLGTYSSGLYNTGASAGAAEISAYDPLTQRLFVINGINSTVDVIDASDPTMPTYLFSLDMTPWGDQANSVSVKNGYLACAVQADVKTDPGQVVFFSVYGMCPFVNAVTVGALPDMLTFTPNGQKLLVANEGEPNDAYTIDPLGTVSVISFPRGIRNVQQSDVVTLDFTAYNGAMLDPSIRVFGPGASVAQDFEPEYIAVSPDNRTAWVTLQENNAIAVVRLAPTIAIVDVFGLGFKDHSAAGNAFDPSDRDNGSNGPSIKIGNWPVFGMYQPDGISAYKNFGRTWYVTANEGDARDYDGFAEEVRVGSGSYALDPTVFPNATTLKMNANLGRLTVTNRTGNTDGDGDFDGIYLFGARSFSIYDDAGQMVYDSGDDLEQITAAATPTFFNSNNDANDFDSRSDNKGPEPEGVATAWIDERAYAFIGLERQGGVVVYDITNPLAPFFVEYVNNRNFAGSTSISTALDLGPEGLVVVPAAQSPTGNPLLVVSNEISGTVSIYSIDPAAGDA